MLAGHIYKLFVLSCFGHCCKTIIFPSVSYGGTNPVFCSNRNAGLLLAFPYFKVSRETPISPMETLFTLGSEYHRSLYQSTPLTPQHMPCLCDHSAFSLGVSEREWLFCFYGVLLLKCMLSQEKRPDVVYQWEFGTDYYILFDCKDLQPLDRLSAQPFTAVAQRYNSVDWLKCLFKVPPRFTPQ